MALRVVMMGTGGFALPAFKALIAAGHDVAALVTQPDRTGQGHHQHINPLKETALAAGIPVFQPEKANRPENLETLRLFGADLFVVAAYGQILSADLLAIPPLGALNLHASLLPKYRGAAPIQYAVWNGETETGVTIFRIEPKLDAGPILGVEKVSIGNNETSGQLHDRLAGLAAPLTLKVLQQLENGTQVEEFQDPSLVTKAPRIQKQQGLIDWHRTALEIGWHVRAMQPWPMPFTSLHLPDRQPQRMLILDVEPVAAVSLSGLTPGEIAVQADQLFAATGDGTLRINVLQPAGKRAMAAADFLRGTSLSGGRFASAEPTS